MARAAKAPWQKLLAKPNYGDIVTYITRTDSIAGFAHGGRPHYKQGYAMQDPWKDDQPIYRQLHERILGLILKGAIKEGEAIPSVRQVASDYQINHLTVAKAYQTLVDQGLVEKRRGLGMFVLTGARNKIAVSERAKFLQQELPQLLARAKQLDIKKTELIDTINQMLEKR